MMDFFVREVRSVVDGQLAIIRFGSCGSIGPANIGNLVVSNGSFAITRNYNYGSDTEEDPTPTAISEEKEKPYNFTKIVHADPELCEKIESKLSTVLGEEKIFTGLNASSDLFYSSQGRHD